jgi:hypothetical protein
MIFSYFVKNPTILFEPICTILGGQNAPYRPQVTIVVRISDYDSFLSLKKQQYYLNQISLLKWFRNEFIADTSYINDFDILIFGQLMA